MFSLSQETLSGRRSVLHREVLQENGKVGKSVRSPPTEKEGAAEMCEELIAALSGHPPLE